MVDTMQCGEFAATIAWGGRVYSTSCYDVSVRVESLAQAVRALAAVRDTVSRERPTWEGGDHERLVASEWRGMPVYLVVSYTTEESDHG